MTSETEYNCINCGQKMIQTRATPSADTLTGLVRYDFEGSEHIGDFATFRAPDWSQAPNGEYVLYSQAAAVVAAKDKDLDETIIEKWEWQKRAEAAEAELAISKTERHADGEYIGSLEAELAQIKAQEPVAWMHPDARWTDVCKVTVANHCKHGIEPLPLYASPAPAADLKAENGKLREALTVASMSAGFQYMTFETRALINAALKMEASHDKG